jgi:hypothetical protein
MMAVKISSSSETALIPDAEKTSTWGNARKKIPVLGSIPKKVFRIGLIIVVAAGIGIGTYAIYASTQASRDKGQ